jgi:ribose transport system permease protein
VLGQLARQREFFLILLIVIIGTALHIKTGHFITERNLTAIALGFSPHAFMAVGMMAAMVSGGFDLSVGSVFALGGVVTAVALRDDVLLSTALPIWLAMVVGVLAGVLAGFINGTLITRAHINPFITTLGMMSIARGAGFAITEGSPIARLPKEFFKIGQGSFWGVSNLIWIALIVLVIGDILMRRSAMFRQIYYVGGNEDAARLSGINVNFVKLGVYTLSGTLAALAGVLSVSRFTVADPGTGTGYELQVIAACIIGGASLSGGKGTVLGALLGLVFVGFINNGMVQLRVPVYWQNLAMGVILLVAVGSDTLSQRFGSRARLRRNTEVEPQVTSAS